MKRFLALILAVAVTGSVAAASQARGCSTPSSHDPPLLSGSATVDAQQDRTKQYDSYRMLCLRSSLGS